MCTSGGGGGGGRGIAMRFSTIVGIFTVMLTLVPGLVFAEHVIDDSKNTGYLFVISGTSGSLDGDKLTLNGVPNVIYFSDRPARKAGHMSVKNFVDAWDKGDDSLKADPPNAVVSIFGEKGSKNTVVELMNPEVKEGSITFNVKVLQGEMPKSFGTASLFVDLYGIDTAATAL